MPNRGANWIRLWATELPQVSIRRTAPDALNTSLTHCMRLSTTLF